MITGLLNYGVNMKDICKLMGKKFACGASLSTDDVHGEVISV